MVEPVAGTSLHEAPDPLEEYGSVERFAVGGLFIGLLAPAAMLGTILWLLPLAGVVLNLIALGRLKREPNRIGRKAALLGLALSVVFGVAPMAQWSAAQIILWRQAQPVADQWFEYLRQNEPEKALMLRNAPDVRQRLDDSLWLYYRNDKEAKQQLQQFVRHEVVRALLALGPRADVRFYKSGVVGSVGKHAMSEYIYTVTYDDEDGKKKTFFVHVLMDRKPPRTKGLNPWRVYDVTSGSDPDKPHIAQPGAK